MLLPPTAVIHQAVVKGDLRVMERVMTLLPSHVNWDLEQSDEMGDTLLMVAARNGDSMNFRCIRCWAINSAKKIFLVIN